MYLYIMSTILSSFLYCLIVMKLFLWQTIILSSLCCVISVRILYGRKLLSQSVVVFVLFPHHTDPLWWDILAILLQMLANSFRNNCCRNVDCCFFNDSESIATVTTAVFPALQLFAAADKGISSAAGVARAEAIMAVYDELQAWISSRAFLKGNHYLDDIKSK